MAKNFSRCYGMYIMFPCNFSRHSFSWAHSPSDVRNLLRFTNSSKHCGELDLRQHAILRTFRICKLTLTSLEKPVLMPWIGAIYTDLYSTLKRVTALGIVPDDSQPMKNTNRLPAASRWIILSLSNHDHRLPLSPVAVPVHIRTCRAIPHFRSNKPLRSFPSERIWSVSTHKIHWLVQDHIFHCGLEYSLASGILFLLKILI